jgi:DNA helicase-2/ATP-dependent DNA helicase PcrA
VKKVEDDSLKLNKEQQAAVGHIKGPLLIVAGAGTGKTAVLTQKIVHLIENGLAKPEEILALTFTEKAAQEMEERVDIALPFGYYDLWISTFHSFCEKVLKDYGLEIGLPTNFKLLDEIGGWILVRKNFEKFDFLKYYKPLGNSTKFIHALLDHFKKLKNEGIYPEDYLKYSDSLKANLDDAPAVSRGLKGKEKIEVLKQQEEAEKIKEVARAYHAYQKLLLDNNALDFGDLLSYTIKLFRERPLVLEKYREQFKYILVDEFQDTNWVQYELLKILAAPDNNITVCADDDQSIYSFSGASFNNVLQFKKDNPESKEVILVKNYRSPQNILDLAYNFIQLNNPNRLECRLNEIQGLKEQAKKKGVNLAGFGQISKKLKSVDKDPGAIEHVIFENGQEEISGVVSRIWKLKEADKAAAFSDFAILARTNEIANSFARGLERSGMPYQFLASKGLYLKPIILDLISYLKILADLHDSSSFYRVLTIPFLQISAPDIAKIIQYGNQKAISIFQGLDQLPMIKDLETGTVDKINWLVSQIKKHASLAKEKNVSELFVIILHDLGYVKYFSQDNEASFQDSEIVSQFYRKLKDFEDSNVDTKLFSFLEQFKMELEAGDEGSMKFSLEDGPESVKIMTLHSAKGLEFKYVFLVNMADRRFPSIGRSDPISIPEPLIKEVLPEGDFHLQEERRLFYVGVTRAKKALFLTWAKDYGGRMLKKPSRFLLEAGFIKDREDFAKTSPKKAGFVFERNNIAKAKPKTDPKFNFPGYFSFTQLSTFDKCPMQYKFSYLLKIPSKGKPALSFGKTMHNALYRFVGLVSRANQLSQTSLFGGKEPVANGKGVKLGYEDLIKIYKEEWIDDWFESQSQKNEYFKQGEKSLKAFWENFQEAKPQILFLNGSPALEQDFRLKVGEDFFIGKIDRIDEIGKENIEIFDYKTGKPNTKNTLADSDKLQLLIYQLALKRVFDLSTQKLTYHYLNNCSLVSFMPKDSEVESTEEGLAKRISALKQSDFAPKPGFPQCNYCDFRDICPYRK